MTSKSLANRDLFGDTDWFLHQIDLTGRRALLVRLSPSAYRNAAFLDQRAITASTEGYWFPLDRVLGQVPNDAPIPRAIFHVGHCGSTLLSRLLGELDDVVSIREPLPLRALAAEECGSGETEKVSAAVWCWYGRSKPVGTTCVVKATSIASNLIQRYLALPDARAVFLSVTLENYLATVLKGTMTDIEAFNEVRLRDYSRLTGRSDLVGSAMHRVEKAVLAWWVAKSHFANAQARCSSCVLIDFDVMVADPEDALRAVTDTLALSATENDLARLATHSHWQRYSKDTRAAYSTRDPPARSGACEASFRARDCPRAGMAR